MYRGQCQIGHGPFHNHGQLGGGRGRGHLAGGQGRGNRAQTFRRGRVLNFLDRLITKKDTLKKQLEQEEYKAIHSVISGELKAIEMVINELVQEFELDEWFEDDSES